MKRFIAGMGIGAVVGTVFGILYGAVALTKAVVDYGVDLNEAVWNGYEHGKHDSEQVIHSWRRKYSTPTRKR